MRCIITGMPRSARSSQGGYCYHVLNRGNARRTVFHKDGDFAAFVKLIRQAGERVEVPLLAFCLMPNHFLTVLRYIERNPVRASLVERAQDWPWSSAAPATGTSPALDPGPVPRPANWLEHVNQPQSEADVETLTSPL